MKLDCIFVRSDAFRPESVLRL